MSARDARPISHAEVLEWCESLRRLDLLHALCPGDASHAVADGGDQALVAVLAFVDQPTVEGVGNFGETVERVDEEAREAAREGIARLRAIFRALVGQKVA